jgi:hypothetical protein
MLLMANPQRYAFIIKHDTTKINPAISLIRNPEERYPRGNINTDNGIIIYPIIGEPGNMKTIEYKRHIISKLLIVIIH